MNHMQTFRVRFYLRSRPSQTTGLIYARLLVDKTKTEFCTHIPATKNTWNITLGLFNGSSVKARTDNQMLEQVNHLGASPEASFT